MKKFLLSMLGVLIALPGIARNFTYEYEGQTLTYTVIDEDAKTCKTRDGYYDLYLRPGNYVSGTLVIPSVAKYGDIEYTVTAIGEKAFYECRQLTSVTIPESVITIGANAFYRSGLTSVTIPNSVTSIGTYAFSQCSRLTSVTIPNSVTSIEKRVFSGCIGLTSVTIPNSVTSISDYAFSECSGLTSVIIPESVTSINDNSFYKCSGLKKSAYPSGLWRPFPSGTTICYPREGAIIENGFVFGPEKKAIYFVPLSIEGEYIIPESVTTIGADAFSECSRPVSVTIPDSFSEIGDSAFAKCYGLTSVTIPNSVISIGISAFNGCSGLTSIEIPTSVSEIGSSAFNGCSSLTSIEIPTSVSEIRSNAFNGCSSLTSVTIPNSVTSIGISAFSGCSGLTWVTIPNSVTEIGAYVFYNCTGLKKSAYPSGLNDPFPTGNTIQYPREGAIIEDGFVYGPEKKTIYFAPLSLEGEYIIPESVTEIGSSAFYGCFRPVSVTIPNSVTAIGRCAFQNSTGLKSVSIGNSVTSIGNMAFYNCSGLTSVTIPNSVTKIDTDAFEGCSSLTSVTISNSVTEIANLAFSGCTALTEVILPPSVVKIYGSAFAGNTNLSTIIMGHNVKYIGEKAFDLCPAEAIYITAQTPPNVRDDAFSFYGYDHKLYVQGQQAADVYSSTSNHLLYSRQQLYLMDEPTEMKAEGNKTLTGKPGDTFQLKATLYPEDVTLPHIFWRSTNPDIATVDANGLVTLHADMSEVMAMAADDDASANSCKIIAESLYADGPVAEFTVNNITTGIEDVIYDGGNASGDIDFSAPVEVYNLQGMRVAHSVENLANGIYIVRQGNNVRKIAVK